MYGKYVEIELPSDVHLKVFVTCTPNTSQEELQKRAISIALKEIQQAAQESKL